MATDLCLRWDELTWGLLFAGAGAWMAAFLCQPSLCHFQSQFRACGQDPFFVASHGGHVPALPLGGECGGGGSLVTFRALKGR